MVARKKKPLVPTLTPEQRETFASGVLNTSIQAAETAVAYLKAPYKNCCRELALELTKQVKAVNNGDMSTVEGVLI